MSQETFSPFTSSDSSYSRDLGIGFAMAVATALIGAYVCANVIHSFGEFGALELLLLGWLAGSAARKMMSRPRKIVGYAMAAAVIIATLVSEVAWIRWNIVGVDSWGKAIGLLPTFCQQYPISALVAGLCGFFGASTAYKEAGLRYRTIQVVVEE